ncbi:hypothetical protein EWM64_g9319 [Hericium alpestre]|uniref:Uncharacterized protein n=1 Tax=Hericium alpestre TaxID=135208 RepID=A0A4Y9ZL67_9AGAM|nr:hypothetical protein EWM64_g9319 [Hericium alpestre]
MAVQIWVTHGCTRVKPYGLVEGTNKILLHVLAWLTLPGLGEEDYNKVRWETLHKTWPDHLEMAVRMLNNCLLPALKFSPRELMFGLVINTTPSPIEESTSILHTPDAAMHMVYVTQQHLDGYEAIVKHATHPSVLLQTFWPCLIAPENKIQTHQILSLAPDFESGSRF